MQEQTNSPEEYLRPAEFLEKHPNLFTHGQLKYLIDLRHTNGFEVAVRKINYRRVLIHVPSALAWIENQRG